jgi:1-hydroxycarotenoid 3,4-desaturase
MSRRVAIVGAGMGGLTAALRLARLGWEVTVLEARPEAGGLASGFEREGFPFDAGPYILLDRPGLEWAFRALDLDLAEQVRLRRIEQVYQVASGSSVTRFAADLEETAAGFERSWPGSGRRYERFVAAMGQRYASLWPMLRAARPRPLDLLRTGAWRHAPFLLRPLGAVLRGAALPPPVVDAVGIWTHIAGQELAEAPSPLAFVPALIHTVGAFYPEGGIATIPRALARAAAAAGVRFRYDMKVRAIRVEQGAARGVETDEGELLPADAVVSNAGGVGTYVELLGTTPRPARERLKRLPLQSPGVCAYLAVRGAVRPPYLRFLLPGRGERCRLLVTPGVMEPALEREGWYPARLLGPMAHARAQALGPSGQRDYLERLLAEDWWREGIEEVRVLATRTPAEWGAEYHLYQDSMNPVMTARFMRAGRLAHRSPYARGLYLCGSATHPGQWVSFCAISGLLAADQLHADLS